MAVAVLVETTMVIASDMRRRMLDMLEDGDGAPVIYFWHELY